MNKDIIDTHKELLVPLFGLINNGNICYFNSLLQCIINCKHIMYYLINENEPKNELQLYFKNKFIEFTELYNNEDYKQFNKDTSRISYDILCILAKKYRFNINEQQSSSEFFLYLIDELGIEHFFKIRHEINIYCGNKNCDYISTKIDECYHFEMFCDEFNETNKIDINNFMYSVNTIQDYKCDKCNTKTKALYEKKAMNISRYFVILLNKYFNKVNIQYPNTFEMVIKNTHTQNKQNKDIHGNKHNKNNKHNGYSRNRHRNKNAIYEHDDPDSCDKYFENIDENKEQNKDDNKEVIQVKWENIAQIEHSGHLNSGHYTALCKRFNRIFHFDDIKVDMLKDDNIYPSKNTYIVFYEKQ